MLLISFFSSDVAIVQSFWPSSLCPWNTGGLFIVMFRVSCSWIVTTLLHGWKIVVYPSSDILCTLMSDCCKCSITSAPLAFDVICSKGNDVLFAVCILSPLGRWTVFRDCPSSSKFNSLLAKCDVAPELITNCFSCCFSICCAYLSVLASGCGCLDMTVFISSCSSSVSLILSRSGAQ